MREPLGAGRRALEAAGRIDLRLRLRLSGSPTNGADEGSVCIVRTSGNRACARQRAVLLNKPGDLLTPPAEPGATLVITEVLNTTMFVQSAVAWTQTLLPFGSGIPGMRSAAQ